AQHDVVLCLLVVVTTVQTGIHGRASLRELVSGNGMPEDGLVAGVLIRTFTAPDATIAVTAAGNAPYFSRRPAIDLLCKTDRRVPHLPPHPNATVGHAKFDIDGSLAQEPDLIVTAWGADFGSGLESGAYAASAEGQSDYRVGLVNSVRFKQEYKSHP